MATSSREPRYSIGVPIVPLDRVHQARAYNDSNLKTEVKYDECHPFRSRADRFITNMIWLSLLVFYGFFAVRTHGS